MTQPPLVNYLPNRVGLTAETAPPPRNPRLQMCLEEDALARIEDNGGAIRSAISDARRLDLSYLPERTAKALSESFDSAEEALRLLPEAGQAAAARTSKAPSMIVGEVHSSLHIVRKIDSRWNRGMRRLEGSEAPRRSTCFGPEGVPFR